MTVRWTEGTVICPNCGEEIWARWFYIPATRDEPPDGDFEVIKECGCGVDDNAVFRAWEVQEQLRAKETQAEIERTREALVREGMDPEDAHYAACEAAGVKSRRPRRGPYSCF